MKKLVKALVLIGFGSYILSGCNRAVINSSTGKNDDNHYDTTTFDYVYCEAIKQKIMGNNGDALKFLQQCLNINPRSDAVYYQMAQIAFIGKDLKNAKKFAKRAESINSRNIWYLMLLANIYYLEKSIDSTVYYYEKAVKYFPENENIKLNLGNLYKENGDFKKAEEIYEYLEEKYGANENIKISVIKNLIDIDDFDKAEEKTRILLQKNPDNNLYNKLLADIYSKQGRKAEALAVYERLLDIEPDNPQTLLSLCDFLIVGKEYFRLFSILNEVILNDVIKKEDKITLFERIIEDSDLVKKNGKELELSLRILEANYKEDEIIPLLRPELYQKQKNTELEIKRIEEIIIEKKENYYAWERLLILYNEKGDYDKLFIKAKECATMFNRSFIAKILYANAALEKEEYQICEEELKKAGILAGAQLDLKMQVLSMEADLYYRKGEFEKSFEIFEEALKINYDNILILNNYAYYLAEKNLRLKKAEEMAKKLIESENGNATFIDTYAWVLYKRGKIKKAAKAMESIKNTEIENDAELCEHYGFIQKRLKNCDKATEYWKKAVKIDGRKISLIKEIENCKR